MKKRFLGCISIVLMITLIITIAGCGSKEADSATEHTEVSDFEGARVGTVVGSIYDSVIGDYLDDYTISYFNTYSDCLAAIQQGVLDCYVDDEPVARYKKLECPIDYINLPDFANNVGYAIPKTDKGKKLQEQMNEFLAVIREDGTLEEIDAKWFCTDVSKHTMEDYTSLPAPNGTLKVMTDGSMTPFNYYENNKLVGYEIEILTLFAKEYGYGLDIETSNFNAIIAAVETNICDIACASITITEEREKKFYFSDPVYYGGASLVYYSPEDTALSLSNIGRSFYKNFITQDRYVLFLKGAGITILISLSAILIGSLLGLGWFSLSRISPKWLNLTGRIGLKIMDRFPILITLMIFYYVILAHTPLDGIAVSVIVFTLFFSGIVYGILDTGIKTVPSGQREAAYALGYSPSQAFLRIVLPQILIAVLPLYRKSVVNLIKGTAVVSYIAVTDLTKMADIIRGRTFEAFFPLISIAVIYILLSLLATLLVNLIIKKICNNSNSHIEHVKRETEKLQNVMKIG